MRAVEHADGDYMEPLPAQHLACDTAKLRRRHTRDLLAQRADVSILPEQCALSVVRAQRLRVVQARFELPLVASLGLLELELAHRTLADLREERERAAHEQRCFAVL